MAAKNGFPVPQRKPVTRQLSGRSLAFAIDGRERAYPVYHFSRRTFSERPNKQTFKGL